MASTGAPPDEMTAAERRRQRILAKRSARMAYAAGDRSSKPREAADEEVAPKPKLSSSADAIDSARMGPGHAERAAVAPKRLWDFSVPPVLRTLLIVVAPLVLVVWTARSGSPAPTSAVELFFQIEVMLNGSAIFSLARMCFSLVTEQSVGEGFQGSGLAGLLQAGSFFVRGLPRIRSLYQDAVLFGFVFLVCARLAEEGVFS